MATMAADDDSWVAVQRRTFTRWVNTCLAGQGGGVESLEEDLRDGVRLIHLLEALSERSLGRYNARPRFAIHRMENLNACFAFLKREGIRVVNIGAQDVEGGNLKIILGLVWTLILHYQIKSGRPGGAAGAGAAGASAAAAGDAAGDGAPAGATAMLLQYARERCEPHGIPVTNFTTSFADGRALSALVHAIDPSSVDMASLGDDAAANNAAAVAAADALGVPHVLEPRDVGKDKHSMLLYLSYLHGRQLQAGAAGAAESRAQRAPTADASLCRVTGLLELEEAVALRPVRLELTLRGEALEEGADDVSVRCSEAGVIGARPAAAAGRAGVYDVVFVPLQAGAQQITVEVNGEALPGFPFDFEAGEAPAAPAPEPEAAAAAAAAASPSDSLLADDSPSLAWLLDGDLRVERASGAALRLAGQSEAEVLGRLFPDELVASGPGHALGRAAVDAALALALERQQARQAPAQFALASAPGAPLLLSAVPRGAADGVLVVAQPLDAARHHCRRCCTLLLDTGGRVTSASDGAALLFGAASPGDLVGRAFVDELLAERCREDAADRLRRAADAADRGDDEAAAALAEEEDVDVVALCAGGDGADEVAAVLQEAEPLVSASGERVGLAVTLADVDDAQRRQRELLEALHEADKAYEIESARDDAEAAATAEVDAARRELDEERARRQRAEHELAALREAGKSAGAAEQVLLERTRAADARNEAVQERLRGLQDEMRFLEDKAARLEDELLQERERVVKAESDLEEHLNAQANQDRAAGAPVIGRWDGVDGRAFRYGFQAGAADQAPRQSVWEKLGDLIREIGDDDVGGAPAGVQEGDDEEEEEAEDAAPSPAPAPAAAKKRVQGHKTTKQFLNEFLKAAGPLEITFEPVGKHDNYRFGTRVVILKVVRDHLLVRVGGGFQTIEEFVANNTAAESKKLKKQLERAGDKQRKQQGQGYKVNKVTTTRRKRRGTVRLQNRLALF